ncbi:type VI secretion protein [Pseudomonas aeruginosa]|uniref:type VI secretion system baseplate subunit TssK n=1 Tax=Pseudomonas aeruginosa TaxID=287 RepID=UPI00053E60AA|nr:type VI secretion system baseplate subunit TssK [Pseudomonas aeruginosa]EKV3033136.1 type VI secretion system baseplate subunit TssK [Pseudomonas aeruginosa]EKV3075316.1 type VI secretion system baseplate subunit TssK [Pseudomonas aeruginosa]MCT4978692.1 type VI secretion system baseplate subunit TssK [Pseudomonas aeruginosa]OHP42017.1 type VI secretion protein [Pseudomonas aeruginosa]TEP81963.1 type VI secretion system baseplate subunit TssK [Pseudomonas aeruginosa]
MTSKRPVIWEEGLFIKPQHFQQQTRALEHHANQRVNSVSPNLYGFTELELNQEFLAFGKIAIIRARGIMQDGTEFDIPADQPPPEPLAIVDNDAINQTIYLTLPLRSEGGLEVRWPDTYGNTRYLHSLEEVRDTHSQEGDYTPVALARLNLQLTLEREDRSAYTGLALARILNRQPDGSLVLDDAFLPTGLSVQAMPALARFVDEATALIRERAKSIAERIASPGQSGVADVTDFNLLQALNRWYPLFLHLSRARQIHPEHLYLAFSQACGELVTFVDEGRLPQDYPAYQHDQPRQSFRQLQDTLRRVLSTVLQPRAVALPLEQQKYGVQTAVVPDMRLYDSADFILAVRAQMPLEHLHQQFLHQVKVASIGKLDEFVRLQLPGIPMIPLPVAPRHLPYHAGFSYFQLDRTHPNWQLMTGAPGFGFHLAGNYPGLEMQFWAIRS